MSDQLKCLESGGRTPCSGETSWRRGLRGGIDTFRCDGHWDARIKTQQGIDRRYPTLAPADFDPSFAGESWDDDY